MCTCSFALRLGTTASLDSSKNNTVASSSRFSGRVGAEATTGKVPTKRKHGLASTGRKSRRNSTLTSIESQTSETQSDTESGRSRSQSADERKKQKRRRKHKSSKEKKRKRDRDRDSNERDREANKADRRIAKKRRKWLARDHLRALTHYTRCPDVLVEHAFRTMKADRLLTILPPELQSVPLKTLKMACVNELSAMNKKQLKRMLRAKSFKDEHGVLVDATNLFVPAPRAAFSTDAVLSNNRSMQEIRASTNTHDRAPSIAAQSQVSDGLIIVEDDSIVREEEVEIDFTGLLQTNTSNNVNEDEDSMSTRRTEMEILELEMRARAIRALLKTLTTSGKNSSLRQASIPAEMQVVQQNDAAASSNQCGACNDCYVEDGEKLATGLAESICEDRNSKLQEINQSTELLKIYNSGSPEPKDDPAAAPTTMPNSRGNEVDDANVLEIDANIETIV